MKIFIFQNLKSKQSGFTLFEAVVATAVFAFVVSGILGVYVSTLTLDTRIRAQNALANDGRFIMDFFAKEIRNGHVAYDNFPNDLTCQTSCGNANFVPTDFHLVNQEDDEVRIYFWDRINSVDMTDPDCSAQGEVCDLYITKAAGSARLNSENVRVSKFRIYGTPSGDPHASANHNVQPHVTVVLELTANYNSRDQVRVNLESTFSTLHYPPRP